MQENGQDAAKVTLACTTAQEKKAYADSEPHFLATERVRTLDPQTELHFILGERSDVVYVIARASMPCHHQLTAYRLRARTDRSTAMILFWHCGSSPLSSTSRAQVTLYVVLGVFVS